MIVLSVPEAFASFAQCDCTPPPSGMALWLPFDETNPSSPVANALGSQGARNTGGTIAPGAVIRGKCRLFGEPVFGEMCTRQSIVQRHRVCNAGTNAQASSFSFFVTALPPLGACNVPGPPTFTPQSGTITVPPGQCVDLPVTVGRPPFTSSFGVACYQLTVNGPSGPVHLQGTVTNGCAAQ